ncbi:hypothetical protein F5Y17DRAFT_4247 [Xylariaceae sp. FL0594]|nr:hypothetical protein F5Y17DRAFT_4247 [Xylariaceae sp. FL0594]
MANRSCFSIFSFYETCSFIPCARLTSLLSFIRKYIYIYTFRLGEAWPCGCFADICRHIFLAQVLHSPDSHLASLPTATMLPTISTISTLVTLCLFFMFSLSRALRKVRFIHDEAGERGVCHPFLRGTLGPQ